MDEAINCYFFIRRVGYLIPKIWVGIKLKLLKVVFNIKLQDIQQKEIFKNTTNNCNFVKYDKLPRKGLGVFLLLEFLKFLFQPSNSFNLKYRPIFGVKYFDS